MVTRSLQATPPPIELGSLFRPSSPYATMETCVGELVDQLKSAASTNVAPTINPNLVQNLERWAEVPGALRGELLKEALGVAARCAVPSRGAEEYLDVAMATLKGGVDNPQTDEFVATFDRAALASDLDRIVANAASRVFSPEMTQVGAELSFKIGRSAVELKGALAAIPDPNPLAGASF